MLCDVKQCIYPNLRVIETSFRGIRDREVLIGAGRYLDAVSGVDTTADMLLRGHGASHGSAIC